MEKFPLQVAYEMEVKRTRSDVLYNGLALTSAILSFVLIVGALILHFVKTAIGSVVYTIVFYPALASLIASVYLTLAQIFRNRYLTVIISLVLNLLTLSAIVASVILQAILLETSLIFPLNLII